MKTKISLLVLYFSLQGYAYTIVDRTGVRDMYKGCIVVNRTGKEIPGQIMLGRKFKPEINIGEFKKGMIEIISNLDAEWLKRDSLKNSYVNDPKDPTLPLFESMSDEDFKSKVIQGLELTPDPKFEEMLKSDFWYDDDGKIDMGKLKQKPYQMVTQGIPKYGFNPIQQLDLKHLERRLTPLQYDITQYSVKEKEGSGQYVNTFRQGKYRCVACYEDLFSSKHKYVSTKNYAAFNKAIGDIYELSFGKITEAKCKNCGAHLGDIVKNGKDSVTGVSYYIKSASIDFKSGRQYID